jgi:biopolymer transport protein ExbD/biopolymer transport protein TolR
MRRFSQRSSLVTLSEINITPLLEQGLKLNLPKGGAPDKPLDKKNIRTVEVSPEGKYLLDRQKLGIDQLESALVADFRYNPNIVVYIRADEKFRWKDVQAVMDRCQRNGITKMSPRTEPAKTSR